MRKYRRLIRLPATRRRRAVRALMAQALRDEQGGEILEYSMVAGLVVVSAIGVISCFGTKVLGRWTSVNSGM